MWLPLSRAEQYYHELLRRANWRTYAAETFDAAEQRETIERDRASSPPPWVQASAAVDEVWKRFETLG